MKARLPVAVALLVLLASACSSDGGVHVRLKEYSIEGPAGAPGGPVTFRIDNDGRIDHEFDVIRTDRLPQDLPVKDASVQTGAPGVELVGKTARIKAGSSATLVVRLRAGAYVFICNVPGHYQSGMRTAFQAL
ncbi:MAG TPA: hypothetical protein VFA34_08180 [Actinomycetota bacterium]|nr:hypothetical protein [Actinomycetota bacterium]